MKFLKLIWRNAARNKRRAVLTILSLSIAIVAISVLRTILYAFNAGVEMSDKARLVTRNSTSIMFQLPISYRQKILNIPGVKSVTWGNWFGGIYQDKKNFFAKFAVDAETYFPMYPEYGIDPKELADFMADRKGCVIGRKIASKFGFKIGDTIPIIGDIYPDNWEFNVRAIYRGMKEGWDETMMIFHWKYLDEWLPKRSQGNIGFYVLQLANSREAGQIAKAVDLEFENSPEQTITETEEEFNLEFVKMMGNVGLLVRAIGSAVVFAILLVAANTMAMSARERTTEIAILKTIGFRSSLLGAIVVAEGLLLSILGWALGCGITWIICRSVASVFSNFFPVFPFKWQTAALALLVSLLTGIAACVFPVLHAVRTTIVGAMREVA